MSVKSVYNFVPAPNENEVFNPDWAEQVSHDIPFSDGESGEIEIEIEAKTPIFIRNGHSKQDAENNTERYLEFSNVVRNGEKEYFIPGSSLKGMFRNVLEIISRSKMSRIDNKRHAVRQIMRTDGVVVDEGYELADEDVKKTINAGWLKYENGQYHIYNCGRPLKIRYTNLDSITNNAFSEHFSKDGKAKISDNFLNRTAKYKYENVIGEKNLVHKFENHPLDENDKQKSWVSQFQKLNYVRIADKYSQGGFKGHIVCAGQAAEYSVVTARKGEYVFKGSKTDICVPRNRLNITKKIFEDFESLNRNGKSDELEDWGYWKDKIEDGIPVFYRTEIKDDKTVFDFGLTFMYKQFAKYTVKDMEPKYLNPKDEKYGLDLADTIFGTTDDENTLKGRVMFSSFKLKGEANFAGIRSVVLSSPRSSYFPYYINQKSSTSKVSSYKTYNTGGVLNGFKRYPIRKGVILYEQDLREASEDMKTNFDPLSGGAVFEGKVRFHNLKKAEIGALLSAISFHNTKGLYHSIGYGKPLGYGKIKVDLSVDNLTYLTEDYIKSFELMMRMDDINWNITELLSIANENSSQSIALEYPELKEFQGIKDDGYYLQKNSDLSNNKSIVQFKNTSEDIEKHKANLKEQELIREKEKLLQVEAEVKDKKRIKEEQDKPYNGLITEADILFKNEEWKNAKEKYSQVIELKPNESYPRQQRNKCNDKLKAATLSLDALSNLNDFNKGKKIIEEYFKKATGSTSINDELQLSILKNFIRRCIQKSGKRWKIAGDKDWKLVIKWIEKQTAQQWYNKLNP